MLVIVWKFLARIPKLLRLLRRMRVVEPEDPSAIRIMERERVPQSVRHVLGRIDGPCMDLDPVAVPLIENFTIQLEKSR